MIQSYLKRTEVDAQRLAKADARVRLVKGAFDESADVAFQTSRDIDLSYVRALKILMNGNGIPLIATHDPRLIEIAAALAVRTSRERSYEFQMLFGVRPEEQKRLAASGEKGSRLRSVWAAVVPVPRAPDGRKASKPRAVRARVSRSRMTAVALIGGGKMGEALLAGLVDAGHSVVVCETDELRAAFLRKEVRVCHR